MTPRVSVVIPVYNEGADVVRHPLVARIVDAYDAARKSPNAK